METPLAATETEIVGQWTYAERAIREDANAKRIQWLLERHLAYISTDESGWQKLYVNPADGQYWELSFPQSEQQGGGPPTITRLSKNVAQQRYRMQK